MSKAPSLPISVRVPPEDADFLAQLELEGAVTPSDKLRAIISQARQRAEGQGDFAAAQQWMSDMLLPAVRRLHEGEHRTASHSELVRAVAEWLPQTAAVLSSYRGGGRNENEQLIELEKALAQRVFQLMEAVLRLGVTEQAPCYDRGIISARLDPVLDLAQVILRLRQQRA